MSTQYITKQVRWQDLQVKSEVDVVFELAKKEEWEDCEIFGYGDMITQPQETTGWKLIPADLYKYSIPTEGVGRLHQVINAGIRVKGVIIADDERRTETPSAPAKPKVTLASVKTIVSSVMSFLGKVFLGSLFVAGVIAFISFIAISIIHFAPVVLILGTIAIIGAGLRSGTNVDYDPKLVILVDDGKGGTVRISLFTWYE
jgi:hypothetical protein